MSATNTNRVSHFWVSKNAPFGSLGKELWKPNIYIWIFFFEISIKLLQSYKDFCKSQSFFLCTALLTLSLSFQAPTYWNFHLQKRLLLDEVFQWWYFFLFLGAGFANIAPAFSISCESQTKYSKLLKYSEQYILDHLSGSKVRIWIGSEYDAVFSFYWIASCNLTKTFTFFCISFLS